MLYIINEQKLQIILTIFVRTIETSRKENVTTFSYPIYKNKITYLILKRKNNIYVYI